MSLTTLIPNSTSSNTGALGGGAVSAAAALLDNNDSTHVTYDLGEGSVVGLDDFTLPTGGVISRVSVRVKISATGNQELFFNLMAAPVHIQTGSKLVNWSVAQTIAPEPNIENIVPSRSEINAATLDLQSSLGTSITIYEAYVDVYYVTIPVVTVTGPTSPVTDDDTPAITWTAALDSEGGAQTHFQAVYMANGQHPNTSTPVADSGITLGSALAWSPEETLPNATYDLYVRVAQTVNGLVHWSEWDDLQDVVINVPAPPVPTSITASAENGNGRIKLDVVEGAAGSVITDYYEIQRTIDNEASWEYIRTSLGIDGEMQIPHVVATGATADAADATTHAVSLPTPSGGILEDDLLIAVVAMDGNPSISWPSGWTEVKDEAGNGSAVRVACAWKRASGGESGTITITTSSSEGGGVRILCVRGAHPTTAPEVSTGANASGTSADPDALNPGGWDVENTLWIAVAGNDGNVAISAGPSGYFEFANTRWANASGAGIATAIKRTTASSENPGAMTLTAEDSRAFTIGVRPWRATPFEYDYEVPNGKTAKYRVRSVHIFASGSTSKSAWFESNEVIFESTAWWLKHPFDHSLDFPSRIKSQPSIEKQGRVGIHQPLNRSSAVTIRDTDEPWQGELVVRLDSDDDRDSIKALLESGTPILVQAPDSSYNWDDRWIMVINKSDARAIDTDITKYSFFSMSWIEVDRPDGALA